MLKDRPNLSSERLYLRTLFMGLIIALSSYGCSNSHSSTNSESSAKTPTVKPAPNPKVLFETTVGNFTIELYPDAAPKTVANFLKYVASGFYDNTIFHRVIPNFVVQGGGFAPEMIKKETLGPIINEADNGLKNALGTLSMARTNDAHSATSQFFINLNDNVFLNHTGKTTKGWGYAVFAKVIEGFENLNEMQKIPTTIKNFHRDVPEKDIILIKTTLLDESA